NLLGILVLTNEGEHIFRGFSGLDNKTVTTRVIASKMLDQCSFVAWGVMLVAAYAVHTIHLTEHRTEENAMKPTRLISLSSPISQCFVHSNACIVCTDKRIVSV
ncbi:hypothetical protein PFISCL1PPCAC_20886, partial [Pristionchus fissidentatus]